MKISGNYEGEKLICALGFFDSIHAGHKSLICDTVMLAKKEGVRSALFTFSDNPYLLKGSDRKVILTYSEREKIAIEAGVDYVISAPPTTEFFSKSPEEFLEELVKKFNVIGFTSGEDYTFGKGAKGDANYLKDYATRRDLVYFCSPLIEDTGEKIATRSIAALIEKGDVARASKLLGYCFFIEGKVTRGRGDGRRECVPTANVDYPEEKIRLKDGVYATETVLDGKIYASVTNVGNHPTFQDFTANVETFILDFEGDAYGKEIKICFKEYLREIKTFNTKEELKNQILKDSERARTLRWKI